MVNHKHSARLLRRQVLVPVLCFALAGQLKSQFYNLPEDYAFSLLTEKRLAEKDGSVHTTVKPYIPFFSTKYEHVPDSHRIFKYIHDDPGLDAVFFKHLIHIEPKTANFKLRLDPLLNLEAGRDFSDSVKRLLYTNTRGFIGSGSVGKRLYFETLFAESQSLLPNYVSQFARSTQVVPGQGRWKTFKGIGFDYAFSSGFISMQLSNHVNLQLGHGKQKIGNGYRSLLLSDNAFNYPYARITQQWWGQRLQYTNIYAVLMNLEPAAAVQNPNSERLFQKKAAAFQHLSLNPVPWLQCGLFQGLIWQAGDSKNRQHLAWQYFNPLIFSNLGYYGLNNSNNLLIGSDVKVKFSNKLNVYGQLMADDLSNTKSAGNAWGFQAGANWFDVLGIKNLFLQVEYNQVAQQSYFSPIGTVSNQSYSHYNQNMGYTPGSGTELIVIGDYKWHRFFANVKFNYQDVTTEGYSNMMMACRTGYVINPAYNLNVYAGITYRSQNFYTFNRSENTTNFVYLGVKTNLYNLYYDF